MTAPTYPARLNLTAYLWSPFDRTISIENIDLTGAALLMQVRSSRDAPGAALIALTQLAAPAQGVSLSVDTTGLLPVTKIRIIINETTIEGLRPLLPGPADQPVTLKWDMLVTPSGEKKMRWLEGDFVIDPGVTV